jgi:hypothetical protein
LVIIHNHKSFAGWDAQTALTQFCEALTPILARTFCHYRLNVSKLLPVLIADR